MEKYYFYVMFKFCLWLLVDNAWYTLPFCTKPQWAILGRRYFVAKCSSYTVRPLSSWWKIAQVVFNVQPRAMSELAYLLGSQ